MPNPTTHPLEVVITRDGRALARIVLRRGTYLIGRDRKNEIVVDDPTISYRHARLNVEGDGEFSIEDLGSAEGTRVNGHAVTEATQLALECHVELGSTSLEFQRGGIPASVFQHLAPGFLGEQRYAPGQIVVQGSTSTIYEARDLSLNRDVAMKVLLPESQAKPGYVLRFIREAQITAQLPHPGILPVYELALDEHRRLYSTTPFVEGDSLASILDRIASGDDPDAPCPSFGELIRIFQKICDAVACAHSRGVVHCTLRPEIITVGRFGEVFVSNWGLARVIPIEGENAQRVEAPDVGGEPSLSRYSAPEQAEGAIDDIGTRTDLHALGGILFRILTLRDPISGETESELLDQALSPRDPPSVVLAGQPPCRHWPGEKLPEALAAIAMKALSISRDDRHASVRELQREIAAWQDGGATDSAKRWKGFSGLLGRH